MMLENCESEEQAQITAYMSGYFDAEGSVQHNVGRKHDRKVGYEQYSRLYVETAKMQMAGFFDGEGSIRMHIHESNKSKIGYSASANAVTKQATDNTMLEAIFHRYCSIHNVSYNSRDKPARDETRKPTTECSICGPDNIRRFLAPLLPVLYEKQRQAVIMLRDIIPAIERGVHLTEPGFIEVMKMKRELDREKPMSNDDRKYTVEYFEDLWGDQIEEQQQITDFETEVEVVENE
jgi:hypothetical protein